MPDAASKSPAAAPRVRSAFVGVSWAKQRSRWAASIKHDGKDHHQGLLDDEQEAARAYDKAARRLRPNGQAHGGRSGVRWYRLNFPTVTEVAYGTKQGMPEPRTADRKSAAAAKAAAQGFRSSFVGVTWNKQNSRWKASIQFSDGTKNLGLFNDEQEAARAFDDAARRLRAKGEAHGVLSGKRWKRLNFPTAGETALGRDAGMPPKDSKKRKLK